MNINDVLKLLYAKEINCVISSFWDGQWQVQIGDELNGFKAKSVEVDIENIAQTLIDLAKETYPIAFMEGHMSIAPLTKEQINRDLITDIALHNPIIYQAMSHVRKRDLTYEESLIMCVKLLHDRNNDLLKKLIEFEHNKPYQPLISEVKT